MVGHIIMESLCLPPKFWIKNILKEFRETEFLQYVKENPIMILKNGKHWKFTFKIFVEIMS